MHVILFDAISLSVLVHFDFNFIIWLICITLFPQVILVYYYVFIYYAWAKWKCTYSLHSKKCINKNYIFLPQKYILFFCSQFVPIMLSCYLPEQRWKFVLQVPVSQVVVRLIVYTTSLYNSRRIIATERRETCSYLHCILLNIILIITFLMESFSLSGHRWINSWYLVV